jgi:hypothetical protein
MGISHFSAAEKFAELPGADPYSEATPETADTEEP